MSLNIDVSQVVSKNLFHGIEGNASNGYCNQLTVLDYLCHSPAGYYKMDRFIDLASTKSWARSSPNH
jgi:hypothetical protein